VRARIKAVARDAGALTTDPFALTVRLEEALDASDLAAAAETIQIVHHRTSAPPLFFLFSSRYHDLLGRRDRAQAMSANEDMIGYLNLAPTDPDALAQRTLITLATGYVETTFRHPGEPPRTWELALEIDPRTPAALVAKARVLEAQLDAEHALAAARDAVQAAPGGFEAQLALARALLLAGRYPESLEASSRVLEAGDDPQALSVKGYALLVLDRLDEARAAFTRACDPALGPIAETNHAAAFGLSLVAARRHDTAELQAANAKLMQIGTRAFYEPVFLFEAARHGAAWGEPGSGQRTIRVLEEIYRSWRVPIPPALLELEAKTR
jgi:tetratricopeptide (TPR) repeat protein